MKKRVERCSEAKESDGVTCVLQISWLHMVRSVPVTVKPPSVNWVEYAVSLATSTLLPHEHYYEPYDQEAAKREWGKAVLQRRKDMGYCEEDTDSDDTVDEQEASEVWELAASFRL